MSDVSSVRRWVGVRRIVRAVVRPRAIEKTSLSEECVSFFVTGLLIHSLNLLYLLLKIL
jgi:hypothetical protein